MASYTSIFVLKYAGLAAVFLLLVLAVVYRRSRYFRLLSKVPAAKGLPLIGQTLAFSRHSDEILTTMTTLFDEPSASRKVLAVWVGPLAFIYLRNIQDIEKLLTSNNLRKSINYSYLKPWLGEGLINSDGEIWKVHRKLITPSFHYKVLERFLETMISKTEILFSLLDDKVGKGYFNIEPYIGNYSLDIITETAMSSNINAQREKPKFVDAIKRLTEIVILRTVRLWYYFNFLFCLSYYGSIQRECISYVSNFISKIMKTRRSKESIGEHEVGDIGERKKLAMLDMLFDLQSKNPQFTDKEVLDEVNTFMFAGHDTTSSGISFVLYLLSVHQDVQEKVFEEIADYINQDNVTYKDLTNFKYLERVIKESLRLYPSVPYIGRGLEEDMLIGDGYLLPKASDVGIFIYNHHRNPDIWPEPEQFNPDRFLPENVVKRSAYAYMPFSLGPRNCIGQKFAMMEIMLVVSKLLLRYKLIVEPGFTMKPVSHIVLRPDDNGVRLKLEKRTS